MNRGLLTTFGTVFAVLCLASLAWAFSTPLGGPPDEPAHIVRAASVTAGEMLPVAVNAQGVALFDVPGALANAPQWSGCFAHRANVPASCQEIGVQTGTVRVVSTAGPYNPLYYAIVGWPSALTQDPVAMVWGMRALTALVSAVLGAAAFTFLRSFMSTGRVAVIFAAVYTPMVLSLSGAVNPNAWEITGVMAIFAAVLALGFAADRARIEIPAFVTIGAAGFVVANVRGVSPLWIAVAGTIGLVLIGGDRVRALLRSAGARIAGASVVLGVAASIGWNLYAGTFTALGSFGGKGWSAARVLEYMIGRTLFETGYVGVFGWTDTPAPLLAVVLLGGIGILTTVAALWLGRGRMLVASAVAIAAWLLLPALVQLAYVGTSGIIWQARYTLAIYAIMVIAAAVVVHARSAHVRIPSPVTLAAILATIAAGLHVWTFVVVQGRWSNGFVTSLQRVFLRPEWSPVGGNLLWFSTILVACVATAVLAVGAVRRECVPVAAEVRDG